MMIFNREPVVIANTFRLLLYAGIALGLELTPVQQVAVIAAFEGVLTLLTRSQVAPNSVVMTALRMPPGSTVADAVEESIRPTAITTKRRADGIRAAEQGTLDTASGGVREGTDVGEGVVEEHLEQIEINTEETAVNTKQAEQAAKRTEKAIDEKLP